MISIKGNYMVIMCRCHLEGNNNHVMHCTASIIRGNRNNIEWCDACEVKGARNYFHYAKDCVIVGSHNTVHGEECRIYGDHNRIKGDEGNNEVHGHANKTEIATNKMYGRDNLGGTYCPGDPDDAPTVPRIQTPVNLPTLKKITPSKVLIPMQTTAAWARRGTLFFIQHPTLHNQCIIEGFEIGQDTYFEGVAKPEGLLLVSLEKDTVARLMARYGYKDKAAMMFCWKIGCALSALPLDTMKLIGEHCEEVDLRYRLNP